ncbi:MAG: hypothetical protein JST52_12085, partial [Bacteroidetes bacterium]|nr:hypothetical protein [Bacteroidota bacterium]
ARIRLVGTFGEPTVTEDFYPTRVNDFDSTDQWSVFNGGGKFGTTIYNGKLGSPEILTAAVNYDRTRLAPLTFFVNYSAYAVNLLPSSTHLNYLPSTFGAANNPMYIYNATFWLNTLMHCVQLGSGNTDPLATWVTPTTMTYYRHWIPFVANAFIKASSSNATSTLIKLKIDCYFTPNGNPLYNVEHKITNLTGADVSSVSLPSVKSL